MVWFYLHENGTKDRSQLSITGFELIYNMAIVSKNHKLNAAQARGSSSNLKGIFIHGNFR